MKSLDLKPVTVAAFDFDHTMIRNDSMRAFLRYVVGDFAFWKGVVILGPLLTLFYLRLANRKHVKEIVLKYYLGGMEKDSLEQAANTFLDRVLEGMIRPEAMERLQWHQRMGHKCYLITASTSIWTRPFAEKYGLELIATDVEWKEGKMTGKIMGLNNYGTNKVKKLEGALGSHPVENSYAYGDSRGDRELLAWAQHAYYRHFPVNES